MKKNDILKSAPFGSAIHRIILNENGKPVDYEFIEVNEAFEKLTGLKKNNILGKTVKEAIPGIENDKFDWIGFYGKIALENSNEIFEQYSEPLGKYYSVHAYSPEKEYFITIFTDITDKVKENLKLLKLINNAGLGTWEWNIKTGETTFNKRWAEMIGYTLEELAPVNIETWAKLVHPDDNRKSNELLNAHFEGKIEQYQCEARMRHKNGQWVWVLDTGKVTRWTDEGKPLLMSGVHQDITERKNTESQLLLTQKYEKLLGEISSEFIHTKNIDTTIIESFAKLASLNNASRVYLFTLDSEKGTMSNTHEWCAEGVSAEKDNLQNLPLSIFPWWMEKLYNKEIIDVPDVSKMPVEAKAEQEILESQNITSLLVLPVYSENQLKGFAGFDNVSSTSLWTNQDTQLLILLADILSNALVKKKNEQELRLLTKAIEESPVSIVITYCNGTITYVNSEFEKTTGYKSHEVLGKNPSILKSGKQPDSFYAKLWDTILAGNTWQGEMQNKTKNGDIFWTKTLISPIKNNDQITHFVGVTQDVSDNKKLIDDLLEAKSKAEESDRLKSAFLATMNHELRTPLNHILGFSNMIPDMTDDEIIKEFAGLIYKSGSNLLSIIEDIFDLAMCEQSEIRVRKQEVFIRDIYLELKKQLQEVLSESNKSDIIHLDYHIDNRIVTRKIITDKPKVIQIMSNLVKNAVKFTRKGKISLAVMLDTDNCLSIILKDTGIGIARDKLKIIFEFFRQVDDSNTRKYDGVGIGLAISQRIAHVMGGKIRVESQPGIGSEFTYSFPINFYEDEMLDSQKENIPFRSPDLSGKKVLIVEDDDIGMELIVNILEPSKCKLIKAINGKEALEAMSASPDINCILMDLKMPVMDGFDSTRLIRIDFPELPIIALTAYSLQKDKKRAMEAGCNDIITKPVNKEILLKRIDYYLKE